MTGPVSSDHGIWWVYIETAFSCPCLQSWTGAARCFRCHVGNPLRTVAQHEHTMEGLGLVSSELFPERCLLLWELFPLTAGNTLADALLPRPHRSACTKLRSVNSCRSTKACSTDRFSSSLQGDSHMRTSDPGHSSATSGSLCWPPAADPFTCHRRLCPGGRTPCSNSLSDL